jgi:hypothetical protein
MTKKITISVSEDLHRQLKNFRDSINISKVCAESLKMKIEKIDLTLHEVKKRFNLLELSEYVNFAYEDGLNWAGYRATPVELAVVCNWTYGWVSNDKQCQKTIELLEENNKEIKKIISSHSVGYEYILSSSFIDKGIVNYFMNYGDGDVQIAVAFAQGAQIIWNKIKNKLIPQLIDSENQL